MIVKKSFHKYSASIFGLVINLLPQLECRTASLLTRHRDVVTTQGRVRGYYSPRPPHYAFLGIPYARPPTRYDRFKAPESPPSWDGTFEATHRVQCPQPDGTGDENCLVVNVFAPDQAESLPVLVHIHGGNFMKGWGSFNTPLRLLRQGLVFVSFNYRLGALGFLNLRTYGIPGNAGLKDQVAALYWINRNIAYFGGNPTDITIYGTGSGGASVELLIITGSANDLFHKAIIESGSSLSPSVTLRNSRAIGIEFAKSLGYQGGSDPSNLENFYYTIPVKQLSNASRIFLPTIENVESKYSHSLLDSDPRELMESGNYLHLPILVAYTNAEEVLLIEDDIKRFKTSPEHFEDLLPNNLIFENDNIKRSVAKMIKDFYFREERTEEVIHNYVNYINNVFLEYPIIKSSIHHAYKNKSVVFLMKFSNKLVLNNKANKHIIGANCGDIMKYIFSDDSIEEENELIAEKLVNLWTNFIKLGDPTPLTTSSIPIIWQPVHSREVFGKPDIRSVHQLVFSHTMKNEESRNPEMILWEHIYNKFYKKLGM